jgi:2-oxoglutarate dehydrogenase complex dehydrogenase (E1) component-like enzyme
MGKTRAKLDDYSIEGKSSKVMNI